MIDLYTWATPNGRGVPITLEEVGLPYQVHPVDPGQGAQRDPDYLRLNPNGGVPTIVDHDGPEGRPITLFECGAILVYLAEKTGLLQPPDARGRAVTLQWLIWQTANVGPMVGQHHHFQTMAPEPMPYARKRYGAETARLLKVMNRRLAEAEYLASTYSIADIATYPWVVALRDLGVMLDEAPNVARWCEAIEQRPAVRKGMAVPRMAA